MRFSQVFERIFQDLRTEKEWDRMIQNERKVALLYDHFTTVLAPRDPGSEERQFLAPNSESSSEPSRFT